MLKKRIGWIDGLKALACIGVFIGHYISAFYNFSSVAQQNADSWLKMILRIFGGLFNGDMWVFVFCMLSGLLIATARVDTIADFIKKTATRYARFVIPFIFCGLFIWLLSVLLGFNVDYYASYLDNDWLKGVYGENITITHILKFAFLFDCTIDGPAWMIKSLFIGNVIVIATNLLKSQKAKMIAQIFVAVVLMGLSIKNLELCYSATVIIGAIIRNCNIEYKLNNKIATVVLALWYIALIGGCKAVAGFFSNKIPILSAVLTNQRIYIAYAIVLILLFSTSTGLQEIMSKEKLKAASKYSFEIYLLHMPLLCAFSLPLFTKINDIVNSYSVSFMINLIITIALVLLISWLYTVSIGKLSNNIYGKFKNVIIGK